ncbi:MAG: ATPase, T2SS/T4P/T4SS family [Planctomycetota bacterium]|nr:ATPase, T2SS/T4P/T4SS family [Planctomycetota bacterium]
MFQTRMIPASLFLVGLTPWFAFGQESWPNFFVEPGSDPHGMLRGPGFYLAMYKLVLITLVTIVWVKLAAWVNSDTQIFGARTELTPEVWNPIVVFAFFVSFLFILSFPLFLLSFPLFAAASIAPSVVYLFLRNGKISKEERSRIKMEVAARNAGKKGKGGGPEVIMAPVMAEEGPPVEFKPSARDQSSQQACLISLRQNMAYPTLKSIYTDAITRRFDQILMNYTRDQVSIRYQVDGIWHDMPAMDRELGDAMLYGMKQLAGMNPEDRKNKQTGSFNVSIPGGKSRSQITSQGVKTGEKVLIKLIGEKKKIMSLNECGMIPSVEERLKGHLNGSGIVLASCLPGDGTTTNWNAVLESSDRILRDFNAIVPKSKDHENDTYVENIDFTYYESGEGQEYSTLKSLLLKQPEALVLPEPKDPQVLDRLADEVANENRFVITRMAARSSAEAIVRILTLKVDRSKFAKALSAVVYHRLVRRLCDHCKQPYQPAPQLLAKLGLKPGQIDVLYREWQPPPPEELVDEKGRPIEPPVCPVCGGLGYLDRIAIFEVLDVEDSIRNAIVNQPRVETIAKAMRQAGHKGLQDEGIKLVLAGVTSLNELQRVLKASQS